MSSCDGDSATSTQAAKGGEPENYAPGKNEREGIRTDPSIQNNPQEVTSPVKMKPADPEQEYEGKSELSKETKKFTEPEPDDDFTNLCRKKRKEMEESMEKDEAIWEEMMQLMQAADD